MKFKILIIIQLLGFTIGFSQKEVPINLDECSIELRKFMLENFDSIKKHTPQDTIFFIVKYKYKKRIPYFLGFYYDTCSEYNNKIEVWKPLEDYSEKLFSFLPNIDPNSFQAEHLLHIVLVEEHLKDFIKSSEKYLENKKQNSGEINYNNKFTIEIKRLFYKNYSGIFYIDSLKKMQDSLNTHSALEIKDYKYVSKLNGLNSNAIWIDENTILVFRVNKTSYEGIIENTVEVFLYNNNKLIYQRIVNINNGVAKIKTYNTTSSEKAFEIEMFITFFSE
jgi:hypothetical protein